MSKKKREQPHPSSSPAGEPAAGAGPRPLVPILLLVIGAAASLLALFQWMELLVIRAGGTAVCAISDVMDCQRIWDAPFASGVHATLGMPVAGLGLVWGLAALGASLAWAHRLLARRDGRPQAAALKVVAWAGLAAIPVLAVVSWQAGAVCLACLTTYAVVGAFAVVALKLVPGGLWPAADLKGGMAWAGGLTVLAYLALLGPGLATPKAGDAGTSSLSKLPAATEPASSAHQGAHPTPHQGQGAQQESPPAHELANRSYTPADRAVAGFLADLPAPEKQVVSNALAIYTHGATPVHDPPPGRRVFGAADAPVKIVEWVDFRCGACRMLNEIMRELKRVAPEGSIAIEPRNFPLDSDCNPAMRGSDRQGVRCLAARASICLEPTQDFWEVRDRLFASQQMLTPDKIIEIASSGELSRDQLEACLKSPQTQEKLREDIEYALRYNPHGTPLLVVNGRELPAQGVGAFLYALSLSGGDARSPGFGSLPPPRAHDPHAGHNHGHHGHAH